MPSLNHHPLAVYLTAGFFSILLSCWISSATSVINTDGICYLQSAEAMQEGLHFAMNLCDQAKWPFYSLLIAGFVGLTKLSYIHAAYLLNGFFSLLTVLTFIGVVHFLSTRSKNSIFNDYTTKITLLWLAASVILLVNEFNSIKHYVIRDHGFWAFYLLSMLFLMYFVEIQRWRYALGWSISIVVATLFRIEGAIFLIIMPFFSWFAIKESYPLRAKSFLQLNIITILLGVGLLFWFLFYPQQSTGRLSELQFQFSHGYSTLVDRFNIRANNLGQVILNVYSMRDAKLILLLMLVAWYFVIVMTNLSLIYCILVMYAWWKKLLVASRSTRIVLWGYVAINVIITAVFLAQNMFLSKRYLVALSLVLMPWVPFTLQYFVKQWRLRQWPAVVAIFFICFSALGGVFEFGHSKMYLYEAGVWLADNASQETKIYSNDVLVMYYSKHFGNQIFKKVKEFKNPDVIKDGKWKQHDFLALRIDKKEVEKKSGILQEINYPPIRVFANKRGDQVRIYRVSA